VSKTKGAGTPIAPRFSLSPANDLPIKLRARVTENAVES